MLVEFYLFFPIFSDAVDCLFDCPRRFLADAEFAILVADAEFAILETFHFLLRCDFPDEPYYQHKLIQTLAWYLICGPLVFIRNMHLQASQPWGVHIRSWFRRVCASVNAPNVPTWFNAPSHMDTGKVDGSPQLHTSLGLHLVSLCAIIFQFLENYGDSIILKTIP